MLIVKMINEQRETLQKGFEALNRASNLAIRMCLNLQASADSKEEVDAVGKQLDKMLKDFQTVREALSAFIVYTL